MKKYFQNLWAAICGKALYQSEVESEDSELTQVMNELSEARHDLAAATEQLTNLSKRYDECWQNTAKMKGEIDTLRKSVENYRDRLSEKDVLMSRMQQDYQERIAKYMKEIDSLKNK